MKHILSMLVLCVIALINASLGQQRIHPSQLAQVETPDQPPGFVPMAV
jgi:hypothetical protein